jgi:hypothetical protein
MNLKRLVSKITISAVSLLASSQVVTAAAEQVQQHQEVFRDYAQEALRLAREKCKQQRALELLDMEFPYLTHGQIPPL